MISKNSKTTHENNDPNPSLHTISTVNFEFSSEKFPLLDDHDKDSSLSNQEKWGIFLLHSLYFVQGIPLGFFMIALSILLTEAGANFAELGVLSFCTYPFCFKILFAPIEDIYFHADFGKRKSYIVPCQYFLSFLFFFLSFMIDNLIKTKSVGTLALIGFLTISSAAIQDIAVDGWNLTLLRNQHLAWGSVSQGVGQAMGILFGGNILIQLSSIKFCNDYFYSEPSNTPLLTLNGFFKLFALVILIINLWVHFRVKERNPSSNEFSNVLALIKELKGFYFNKNLRMFVFLLLTGKLGFSAIMTTASLKLIQKGFPKENLSMILICLVPFNFFISFLVGKYVKIGREMTNYLRYYVIFFFVNVFFYFLLMIYGNISNGLFNFLFIIACLIGDGTSAAIFVNQGGFTNRISDEEVGGTYLTFLNSMSNFGKLGAASFVFFLVEVCNYTVLAICSWVYIVVYFALFYKKFLALEKVEKKDWKL